MHKIFKKINRYQLKRYFLVLILFMLAFIFGKKMDILSPEQQQLRDQIYTQQKISSGIYNIAAGQQQYEIKKSYNAKKNQCGRLFFDLKNLSLSNASDTLSDENSKIKVMLNNDFDQKQELDSFDLKNDSFIQNEEIDFCANADYQNLLIEKDKNSKDSSFEISGVAFYPLSIEKHDFSQSLTPVRGDTDFSRIIYQSSLDLKDANKAFKFNRKNQLIGQTFIADSDVISGVDLKLEFEGSGGIGNYLLELKEANNQNGKIQLMSDRIAYFSFGQDGAEKNLKIGEKIYHIPLVAHLEKGKIYFIGISNEAVKFNILNTLKVYGTDRGSAGGVASSVGGNVKENAGSLYLKVYGADYIKVGNEKVLTGAKILDNGDGTGLYIYEQKGNFSDYLDLEQSISEEDKNSNIFYDNIQAGVAGNDIDNNAFIYKANALYPFAKLKIDAEQSGGQYTNSLVYYSYDGNTWQEIKSDWNKKETPSPEDKNKFHEVIQGDEKTKTVYIKVTYDKNDAKEKNIHLFGLKNLKIIAELKLK